MLQRSAINASTCRESQFALNTSGFSRVIDSLQIESETGTTKYLLACGNLAYGEWRHHTQAGERDDDSSICSTSVSSEPFPVNAYLIESAMDVTVVDATLGRSDGQRLRAEISHTGKPLAGVIVTHAHPDHYGAVCELVGDADVPVYAVAGVDDVIRRDDADKERILRPMFGDEWPATRTFPTHRVSDGDRVSIGSATFRVVDAGPGESPHDSWWMLCLLY